MHHPLTVIRRARGWTTSELGMRVDPAADRKAAGNRVWRWETGRAVPPASAQRVLADVLGIDRREVAACGWPGFVWRDSALHMMDMGRPWTRVHNDHVVNSSREAHTDRRTMLAGAAGLAGVAVAGWAAAEYVGDDGRTDTGPERVGAGTVRAMQTRVQTLATVDDEHGGTVCAPLAAADYAAAVDILNTASYGGATERGLYAALSRLARAAGWAAFDTGRAAAAQRYWHAALRAAATIDDDAYGAYIVAHLGLQLLDSGHVADAVEVFDAADGRAQRADGCTRGLLRVWQSRALAMAGRLRDAHASLDAADAAWASCAIEDRPEWAYWMDTRPSLSPEVGRGFLAAGHVPLAEQHLVDGLREYGRWYPRDAGLYQVGLAECRARVGDRDGAVDWLGQVPDEAAVTPRVASRMEALTAA